MNSYADYYFLISLPDNVTHEIGRYKKASVGVIGQYESMNSPAHVSVCTQQRCKPFLVEPALERMENRINTMPAVELQIKGFNFFNHANVSYTIYAKIEINPKVNNWFKLLFNQMQIKCNSFSPHVTVARNIPGCSFRKLWPNFEGRQFDFLIRVNHMIVLQRPTYLEHQQWQECKKMYFENKIATTNQHPINKLF